MRTFEERSDAIDSASLDRLVDGDLTDTERRELLLRLESDPDGWRRCALAFLEDQAWRDALATVAPESTPVASSADAPFLAECWSTGEEPGYLASSIAASLMAATFAAGFAAGGLAKGGPPGRGREFQPLETAPTPTPTPTSVDRVRPTGRDPGGGLTPTGRRLGRRVSVPNGSRSARAAAWTIDGSGASPPRSRITSGRVGSARDTRSPSDGGWCRSNSKTDGASRSPWMKSRWITSGRNPFEASWQSKGARSGLDRWEGVMIRFRLAVIEFPTAGVACWLPPSRSAQEPSKARPPAEKPARPSPVRPRRPDCSRLKIVDEEADPAEQYQRCQS